MDNYHNTIGILESEENWMEILFFDALRSYSRSTDEEFAQFVAFSQC